MDKFSISTRALFAVGTAIGLVMMIPLIGMQLSTEVNWQWGDFVVAAIITGVTGYICAWSLESINHRVLRVAASAFTALVAVALWIGLATG